jgi:hypothetical protein
MTQMTKDAVVVTVQVEAPQPHAFDVFTSRFGSWWPMEHHIGSEPAVDVIIEPRVGGRWFERAADGSECEWGRVLEWDAPERIVLAWQLNPEFDYDPDPAMGTRSRCGSSPKARRRLGSSSSIAASRCTARPGPPCARPCRLLTAGAGSSSATWRRPRN